MSAFNCLLFLMSYFHHYIIIFSCRIARYFLKFSLSLCEALMHTVLSCYAAYFLML